MSLRANLCSVSRISYKDAMGKRGKGVSAREGREGEGERFRGRGVAINL